MIPPIGFGGIKDRMVSPDEGENEPIIPLGYWIVFGMVFLGVFGLFFFADCYDKHHPRASSPLAVPATASSSR